MSEYGTQLREGGGPEWDFEEDRNPESGSLDAGLLTQPAVSSERIAQLVDTLGLALRVGADQAGDGPEADVITYADRWLRDTSGMTYGAVLNVLELADAQDGIDWTHSLVGPQTPQFDVRHIGGWANPFSAVMDYGTAVWDVTGAPWLRLVQGKPTETFGHDLSRAWQHATQADTRLYGYGGNPYGNKAANFLGVHSPSDALWAALDIVDIASLRWGGAIIAPVRQMLREAAERGGRREIADAIALQSRSIRPPDRFGPEHDIPLADTLDQLRPDRFGPEHDIPLVDTLDQLSGAGRYRAMLARGRAKARTWFDNLSDKDQAAAIVEWEKSSKPHYTDPNHVFDPADDYDVRNAYTAARRARETEMRTMWDNISTGEREVIEADYRAAMPTFPEGIDPDPADMMRWYEQQGPPGTPGWRSELDADEIQRRNAETLRRYEEAEGVSIVDVTVDEEGHLIPIDDEGNPLRPGDEWVPREARFTQKDADAIKEMLEGPPGTPEIPDEAARYSIEGEPWRDPYVGWWEETDPVTGELKWEQGLRDAMQTSFDSGHLTPLDLQEIKAHAEEGLPLDDILKRIRERREGLPGTPEIPDDLGEMFRREIPDFTPPGQPPMGYRDILAMDKDELLARHLGDGDNATTEWYVATLEAELVDLQGTLDAGLVKGRAKIEHRINEIYAEFETGGFWKNVHGTLKGGRPLDPGGRSGGYGERLDFTTDEIDEIVRNNGPTDEEIRAFYENREGPPSGPVSGGAVTVDPHDELLVWSHPLPLVKIISGGQTGADIAGLSAGKELGLEVGGVAPRGYRTDAGSNYDLRDLYGVKEHASEDYPPRTLENIRNSDGTILFDFTPYSRGSDLTRNLASKQNKPLLDIRSADDIDPVAIRAWIINENIRVLNVAGNRESSVRGLNQIVHDALTEMAGPPPSSLGFDVGPPRARPVVGESPAEVNLSLMTLTERKQFLEESLKDLDTLPDQYFKSRAEGGFGTQQGIAKQRKDLQDAIKEIDVRLAAEQELKESLVQGTASGTIVHFGRKQNTILSPLAETPFRFRGAEFRTAEGAYQAWKSGAKRDGYEKMTGPAAKSKGHGQYVNRRTNLDLMREILAEKYRQVPEFRDALNAAEGQITHPVGDVFWRDKLPMLLDELRTPTAKSGKPVVEYIAHMDVATLRANPEKFYLFGDNLQERGKRGQAIIRDEPNAIGIPTKKRPSMNDDAFFTDTELASNQRAIDRALDKIPSGATVVIPEKGLGTGLARLEQKAPKTFEYLQTRLDELRTPTAGSSAAAPPAAQTKEGFEREALETFEKTNESVIPPHIQVEDIMAVLKDSRGYVSPQSTPELAADHYSRLVEVIDYRSEMFPFPGHSTVAESVHQMLTDLAYVITAPPRAKSYPPWPRSTARAEMLKLTREIDAAVRLKVERLDSMEGGRIDIDAKEARYREEADSHWEDQYESERGMIEEHIDESGPEMDREERDALFREETERLLENPPQPSIIDALDNNSGYFSSPDSGRRLYEQFKEDPYRLGAQPIEEVDLVHPIAYYGGPEQRRTFRISGNEAPPIPASPLPAPVFEESVYHGAFGANVDKLRSYIDPETGELVLYAASNFEGRVSSVSFSPSIDSAWDYGTRIKGGGPDARTAGLIFEIDRSFLDKRLVYEAEEELAVNFSLPHDSTNTVRIPSSKFRVIETLTEENAAGWATSRRELRESYASMSNEELADVYGKLIDAGELHEHSGIDADGPQDEELFDELWRRFAAIDAPPDVD